jgi:homoserine dehydrogenase
MLADSMPYDDALKQAQALGFAEADPIMDVSGMDVAYKVIILAGVAFHVDIPIEAMPVEGIESIQLADMLHAQDMGYVVKLIGAITATDNGLAVRVCPMLLPNTHAMATVNNEVNALFLHGDCVGDAMMVGKGAGGIPTASAILSDVVAIGASTSTPVRLETAQLVPLCDQETAMYMRVSVQDHVGVLEQVTHALSQAGVSLKTVVQKNQGDEASIILITHPVKESVIQGLQLNELPAVLRIDAMLRVV